MEPLCQALAVIPQLIMSLCAVSMVTYNKLFENIMPFYGGNKTRPRINVTTRTRTLHWLFDMGAAVTCMSANSFRESFKHTRPKLLSKSAACIVANGSLMNSLGVFEIEMTIIKFLHPVTVIDDINYNILGIDFMHTHKLNFDSTSKQITFAQMLTNALYSLKKLQFLPFLQC